MVVAGPADRNRDGLVLGLRGVLSVGNRDIVGLGHGLAGREVDLVVAGHEVEADRHAAIAFGHRC